MTRALGLMLAFLAALTQLASGALPSDIRVCIPLPSPIEACCCCCDDDSRVSAPACPCRSGCDRCLSVTPPDGRATLTAGPRTGEDGQAAALPMSFGLAPILPHPTAPPQRFRVRPNESPPDIPIVRTIRLLL